MEINSSGNSEDRHGQVLHEWYFIGVVLFITAITYLGTLGFGFVYDDDPQIASNPFVKSWHYVPQYFASSVWKYLSPLVHGNHYRPIFLLWVRANDAVLGSRDFGWHLMAVLLHLLATWLVYCVIRRMTGRFTVAWLAALIFGVHPIHHEVVAWVSGTTESLFAVLFLAAFLAYLRSEEHFKAIWMMVSCVLYGLALLSKETAIVLPALVFAHVWITEAAQEGTGPRNYARRLTRALVPVMIYAPFALIYLVVRARVLSGFDHSASNASIFTWLLTLPSILLFYVKNWFLPIRLSEFYDVSYQTGMSFSGVVFPALILLAIAVAVWMIRKRIGAREAGYAAIWVVIPLLPALDTFVFGAGQLVHDRYFYVPSVGASLLMALVIDWALQGRALAYGQPLRIVAAALALAVLLGMCAAKEASFWRSDFSLYTRGHAIAPQNPTALNNLGAELIFRREIDKAEALLEQGYHKYPDDYRFGFNLGRLNYIKKDYSWAEAFTRQSLKLDPNAADSYILLGQIQLQQHHAKEGTESIHHSVELNPYNATYRTSYGIVLEMNGDCTSALSEFQAALALHPGDALTQREMFRCHAALDKEKSLSAKPNAPQK